ncbi:MAG: hypothetical protein FWG72_01430 [Oscillospiraceae bacterium]|nr:hypothetical protein [Oscillospiraceae bacterium]
MENQKEQKSADARQTAGGGRAGHIAFALTGMALLADAVLYAYGIRWIEYPGNTLVILTACFGLYAVWMYAVTYRPGQKTSFAGFARALAGVAIGLFLHRALNRIESPGGGIGAAVFAITIIFTAMLLAFLLVAAVRKIAERKAREG